MGAKAFYVVLENDLDDAYEKAMTISLLMHKGVIELCQIFNDPSGSIAAARARRGGTANNGLDPSIAPPPAYPD